MTQHKPDLLVLNPLMPWALAHLAEIATVHDGSAAADQDALLAAHGGAIRGVLTIGTIGLSAQMMERLPRLEIVSCMGVGYEGVDVPAAKARGVVVSNGHGTNAASVADHALALMLCVIRGVTEGEAAVRRGEWRQTDSSRPEMFGMRLGVIGLGSIGQAIARRCALGFDMEVAYHNRTPRTDVPYTYCGSVAELARRSDVLVAAAPGGPESRHLVNRAVLDELGPEGFLVNIARGSLVDTGALIDALRDRRIAGAALDVVEGEPHVPPDLLACPGLVMTPHTAGRSPKSVVAMIDHARGNFDAHFAGRPVSTRVA